MAARGISSGRPSVGALLADARRDSLRAEKFAGAGKQRPYDSRDEACHSR